jgi:hypothetical protein
VLGPEQAVDEDVAPVVDLVDEEAAGDTEVDGAAELIGRDPLQDFDTINAELAAYGAGLEEKPQVVAVNRMDLQEARDAFPAISAALTARGYTVMPIAAAIGLATLSMVTIGVMLGRVLGAMAGRRAELAGGLILIAIGTAILVDHLSAA